jgi:FkbM family methyltransferase
MHKAISDTARRLVRAAWDGTESALDGRVGRPVLRELSRAALALQYRRPVNVRYSQGAWEYRWPDGVVMSDRALITRARPGDEGGMFFWGYKPKLGDVVVDIGAGIGEELHELVRAVGPIGRVIAVEAHPRLCAILDRLVRANGWSNVAIVNAAITDGVGTVTLTDERASLGNDIFRPGTIDVAAQPLSELLAPLDRVDFLKMNIEGAETLALAGMGPVAHKVRNAAISCHDFIGRPTMAPVRRQLEAYGFAVRENPQPETVSRACCLYAARPRP